MTRDILLQIGQVATVIVLAPLLQGVILQRQERPARPGPGYLHRFALGRHVGTTLLGVPIFERLLERPGEMPAQFGVTGTEA